MSLPIVINPCSILILNEKFTFSMYSSCIITLNPPLVKGYHLFTIFGKITNWWLQSMNSLPNFFFGSFMVCFNNIIYLRIVSKCRPVIIPFYIFPSTVFFLREKFTVTTSFGKRITFNGILLESNYLFTIIRKIPNS